MGNLVTMRVVLESFKTLEAEARAFASTSTAYTALRLHDAALKYASVVRKVSRRERDR